MMKKNFGEGINLCDKALSADPICPEAYGIKGKCFSEQKDFPRAITNFGQAIELTEEKKYIQYYVDKAEVFEQLGKYDKAFSCYEMAVQAVPTDEKELLVKLRLTQLLENYWI